MNVSMKNGDEMVMNDDTCDGDVKNRNDHIEQTESSKREDERLC